MAVNFIYELALTNKEVRMMFEDLISEWFYDEDGNYNAFIKAYKIDAQQEKPCCFSFSFFANPLAIVTKKDIIKLSIIGGAMSWAERSV